MLGNSPAQYVGQGGFKGVRTLGHVVTAFLILQIVFSLVLRIADTIGVIRYPTWTDPNAEYPPGAGTLVSIVLLCVFAQVILYITTAILFLVWSQRTTSNSRRSTNGDLDVTPGWAIGWWFVPIANLFKPLSMVQQNYKVAQRSSGPWRSRSSSGLVNAWWTFWVIFTIIDRVESQLVKQGADLGQGEIALNAVSGVIMITAAVLAIMVVQKISAMQHQTS